MNVLLNRAVRFVLQSQEEAPGGGASVHLVSVVEWLKKEFTPQQINELYRQIRVFSDPDVGIDMKPALDALEKAVEIAVMEDYHREMPYMKSAERIGVQKGQQKQGREMVLEVLDERFGEVPDEISNAVSQIKDRDKLKILHRQAIRCASLADFKKTLDVSTTPP